jgi:transposase
MTLRALIYALKLKGQPTGQIATALGICTSTVRYHVRHHGCEDGRKNRRRKIAAVAPAVDEWILARYTVAESGRSRRLYLRDLHAWLRKGHGYEGSQKSVERYVREKYPSLRPQPVVQVPGGAPDAAEGFEPAWVLRLLLGKESLSAVREKVGNVPDLPLLYRAIREGGCKKRGKALSVLGFLRKTSPADIARTLQLEQKTVKKYKRIYTEKGVKGLLASPLHAGAKCRDEKIRAAVLSLLHSPPSLHDINRTSWKYADLQTVLKRQGISLSQATIRKVIRATGFKWRKARIALTSNDPQYREKVDRIKSVLSNLGPKERFFSIDEFGPFAIKMRGGLVLCDPDKVPVIPQFQKSKGSLIVTSALELSTNQVTHFYSPKKDTEEMIKLFDVLLQQHLGCERLYLSWDAASWHDSDQLHDRVAVVNSEEYRALHRTPFVELVPLPSRAQFLNVIESVFSGMARAIIHNSDYQTVEEAMAAIDRYFLERNNYFTLHPKRAGRKIWGKERVPCQFSEANNCKDPAWCHRP